jgi:hypothetical protein
MSILIKGAKMPSSCAVCPCYKWESDYGCAVKHEEPKDFKKRPSWCPLVEIPPHGRLIDANETKRVFGDYFEKVEVARRYAGSLVDNAIPTVIESEVEDIENG